MLFDKHLGVFLKLPMLFDKHLGVFLKLPRLFPKLPMFFNR